MSLPIPQPPGYPLLGNITDIDPEFPLLSLAHLAEKYGPIFKLSLFGRERYFVSSVELCNELCDEKRFCKIVSGPLEQVRNGIGDGLFTAHHGERNWEIAHRVLVPAFGPLGIKDMFDEMYDIATQLIAKWARIGPEEPINVTDDFTRLTLDSIALCAMDKRFNSFYSTEMHPFVGAMVGFLVESGRRNRRTRLETLLNNAPQKQYEKDIALMQSVAREVIVHRRANPVDKKDLLNAMLFGKDPKTGERLSDDNVMNNMITFLIAGHETTSGLLSFTSYLLMKNPEEFRKAQQEVDRVVGSGPVKFEHMSKLPYIEACMRESLRLYPTAPAFAVQPVPGTNSPVIIGGGYHIPLGAAISCMLPQIGRDQSVYGSDAEEFKPERMYGEKFQSLPPNAWKPFGNGARGCIGRPFAWQEAILVLALILQNFNLRFDNPTYQMQMKTTLTIKPDRLFMKASLRDGIDPIKLEKKMYAGIEEEDHKKPKAKQVGLRKGKPMTVLYGSNAGTCEGLSQSLATSAETHGYHATVKSLDDAANSFPTDQPVVLITASYEGNPPDNAALFVDWLKNVDSAKLTGAQFAVFGCGHRDWVSTFQKIPKLLDSALGEKGATRLANRGEADVARGTVFDDFDQWQDTLLWPALSSGPEARLDTVEGLEMEISTSARASHLRHNVQEARVVKNELLSKLGAPEKRHMEFKLPTNMTYEAGDYLAVLPINNVTTVGRVLRRFGLPWDASMKLAKGSHTTIPTEMLMPVTAALGAYVELNSPATKKNLAAIAKFSPETKLTTSLNASVLDVLEAHPEIQLPFPVYLSMLTPMRLRQYSISSSPLADPTVASITYSVLEDHHLGVATNYLKSLLPGSTIQLSIKKSHASFHLPSDETKVIMVAAGTGLAPFRGFVQERVEKIKAGRGVGEAILIIGCRDPETDVLYKDQLKEWQDAGAAKIYYAYSRASEQSGGCKYAQDRVWKEREEVRELFDSGARAYICGSARLGRGVAEAAAKIMIEGKEKKGEEVSLEKGLEWWEGLRGERFAVDVFD